MTHFMAAGSDSHSVKSSSPLDTSLDLTGRVPQSSPASSPTPTSITPLTRSQLQQALLHLIQVNCIYRYNTVWCLKRLFDVPHCYIITVILLCTFGNLL